MKPRKSTTTSALTGIDDSKEYFFMSSDLVNEIDLEHSNSESSKLADLTINDKIISRSISSIEIDGEGYIFCVIDHDALNRFVPLMLQREAFKLSMQVGDFNCHVFKVEPDRCYLRAAR